MSSDTKLSIPAFLKILTSNGLPMAKAMPFASKVSVSYSISPSENVLLISVYASPHSPLGSYKTHNTPSALGKLTDLKLAELGVDKDDRKTVLAAFKKAGFKTGVTGLSEAGPSKNPTPARKRKRDDDLNEMLPSGPRDEGAAFGSFEFKEVFDEESLRTKFVVVNRAPVMTAWAMVVAERVGFKREEALSIASAYTEMNAISKGVSIGIFNESKAKGVELAKGESQPYIDLMGRRPVYSTQSSEWRALVKGEPIAPATAFKYMTSSFRQTLPFVLGAMRLLAETYTPAELTEKGFGLYADFRPEVGEWGGRAQMRCEKILSLRKPKSTLEVDQRNKRVEDTNASIDKEKARPEAGSDESQPALKARKIMSLEEYEATLDEDFVYDDLAFNDAS